MPDLQFHLDRYKNNKKMQNLLKNLIQLIKNNLEVHLQYNSTYVRIDFPSGKKWAWIDTLENQDYFRLRFHDIDEQGKENFKELYEFQNNVLELESKEGNDYSTVLIKDKFKLDNPNFMNFLKRKYHEYKSFYEKGNDIRNIKQQFFNILGDENSLKNYQKAYIILLLKGFFELTTNKGEADFNEIAEYFKKFYLDRKDKGFQVENNPDSRIENIKESSINDIKYIIRQNPLNTRTLENFLSLKDNKVVMNVALWSRLNKSDIYQIRYIVNKQLVKYFNERVDGDSMAIPNVNREKIEQALNKFDQKLRNNDRWKNFKDKKNHKYAISYNNKLYPVKQIISMATGAHVSSFSGGEGANDYIEKRGFEIVDLNNDLKEDDNQKLLLKKKVDWSVFNWGITVPAKLHEKIYNYNGEILSPGESENAVILVNGRKFDITLRNINRDSNSEALQIRYGGNSDLINFLKQKFNASYQYIIKERKRLKSEGSERPRVDVPDEKAEYIKFYKTDKSYVYKIKLITNEEDHDPNIWWVNQGRTLEEEKDSGILWAPIETEKGRSMYHWETMKEVEKGDIVLHYANGSIKYVSKVKKPAIEKTRPRKIDNTDWDRQGRLIEVEYIKLEPEIVLNKFANKIKRLDIEKGPINIKGEVNQGYLFRFNKEGLRIIQQVQPETGWPEYAEISDIERVEINIKDKIRQINNYIENKGFTYPPDLIENFYLSLKSKPFVLLAGISGTGKTQLVRLFAEAIGCTQSNGRFELISVRPDWSDTSDLLGYKDIKGKFQPGPMIDIIKRASEDKNDNIYIVCLDEMNLARVEYYFSDFLSIMETRRMTETGIETDYLLEDKDFVKDNDIDKYSDLRIPDNLYIVGTVNMDETTHPFSKKVLDRANTIEFSDINLSKFSLDKSTLNKPYPVTNNFLRVRYITLNDCHQEDKEFIKKVINRLQEVNEILEKASLQVGYRVRDEIVFYMLYNEKESLLDFNIALDLQIMQKILPRIQGSSRVIKEVLIELFAIASGKDYANEEVNIGDKAVSYIKNNDEIRPYPKSAEKLAYMIKRIEADGFTAYWL